MDEALWRRALADAQPGPVSAGSYAFCCYYFGPGSDEEVCDWPQDAHPLDIRPLTNASRERMYEDAAAAHRARVGP